MGNTFSEAFAEWLKRTESSSTQIYSINQLADRYLAEVLPTKAIKSQEANRNQMPWLRKSFGELSILKLIPQKIYLYVDQRSQKTKNLETGRMVGGKIAAYREIELLSHKVSWNTFKFKPNLVQEYRHAWLDHLIT